MLKGRRVRLEEEEEDDDMMRRGGGTGGRCKADRQSRTTEGEL
jgi:hypothetical protein